MHITDDLIALLRNFKDFSGVIDENTYFFKDMGMSSIDAVVLAEMLEQYYGKKIRFGIFLAQLKEKKVQDIQLGELALFLTSEVTDAPHSH